MDTLTTANALGRPPRHGLGFGWIALGLFAVLLAIWAFYVPALSDMFREFGVRLPWATQAVITISDFFRTPIGMLSAVGVLVVVGGPLAWASRRNWALGLALLGVVVSLYLVGVAVLGFPLVGMIESLQSEGAV
jgi:type II secretory pathway component PulF